VLDGVEVNYFHSFARPGRIFLSPGMIKFLSHNLKNFDIVHLHLYRTFHNLAFYCCNTIDKPYVLSAHGNMLPTFGNPTSRVLFMRRFFDLQVGKRIVGNARKVIAISKAEANEYLQFGVEKDRIEIVPNGIDLPRYAHLPPIGRFRTNLNISENEKLILYLGRLNKSKGLDFLVSGFAALNRGVGNGNTTLVIAGPNDGALEPIERLARHLGVSHRVIFPGFLSEEEKTSAYVDSDVVVNLEPGNVFGLVPLEAAACSTPVIVSKGNAISEAVREGAFGFSVEYGDTESLAMMLRNLLYNLALASKMGQNGRSFVFENYGWPKVVDRLEEVYKNILGEG
jgi:glycosyltransferase involved in cell wall biosynthesis